MWVKSWGLISVIGGLAACKKADDFPIINPMGVDSGVDSGVHHDAAVDAPPDAPVLITGKVCLLDDLRNEATCDAGGTGVVNVTLGGTTVATDTTGAFSIADPGGPNLVWHVSGEGIVNTAMTFDLGTTIPTMATPIYDGLAQGNTNAIDPLQGSLVVRCRRGTMATAKAMVGVGGGVPVLYDTTSATTWDTTSTGALGLAWLPNVPAGPALVTAMPFTGAASMATFTIEPATITFADMSL